ncbi:tyrosine-type recombinase/integrase [Pseudoduganella buxea]|uniref:Tyrosine-type recombinase/integrase n=1 Tax=Pseudoduganella buxea TaxID=1949069 RepID=A0A6I3T384_9BURK|nr:tyrosine-type recombinase/integrase [Pseudoduganella buxea]MTV54922.1 tyrosine-type recombinase/integrase [Pseudoduganella buxea]GGC23814.1 hypothetical protein GCM10011572_51650 [Pseudoduganella buxea]
MNDDASRPAPNGHLVAAPSSQHILGAVADDWAAVDVWLAAVASNSRRRSNSDDTVSTYRYHVAKVRWYCEHVLGRTLSAWDAQDVLCFEAFLADLPLRALCPAGAKATQSGYTPFRRRPGVSSQADILRCLRALFGALHGAGYLRTNPMSLMKVGKGRRLDKTRAIDDDLFERVLQVMDRAPRTSQRAHQLHARDRFILVCLRETGVRASELVGARMRAIAPLTDPKTGTSYWVLQVDAATAKGGQGRVVPVSTALMDALVDYRCAFGLPALPGAGDRHYGLILSVRTQQIEDGMAIKTAVDRRYFGQWRDVGTRYGLHDIVKGRLQAAVTVLRETGDDAGADRLARASTHWLRHTFALRALLGGQDLRTVATALGHASVSTTMLYTEQEALDQINSWERNQPGRLARVDNAAGNAVL